MTTGTFFRTTDLTLLAQFMRFDENTRTWNRDVKAFTDGQGATGALGGIRYGKGVVQALRFEGGVPARWKREGHGFAPYKNNPVRPAFDALTRTLLTLDGVDLMKLIYLSDGRTVLVSPTLFVHENALYLTYSDNEVDDMSDVWEPISKGAYLIAHGHYLEQASA